MVYLNLSKSASQPLCLLGRLDQRAHSLDGPLNGGACENLAAPGVMSGVLSISMPANSRRYTQPKWTMSSIVKSSPVAYLRFSV
jgi:hypothetical protein